jgi:hypothetical protein
MSCEFCHSVQVETCCPKGRDKYNKPKGEHKKTVEELIGLIEESTGIVGFHLNGDVCDWQGELEDLVDRLNDML